MSQSILVTGAAGFIGSALSFELLKQGHTIVGIDNLSSYYDVALKRARVARCEGHPNFKFELLDITHRENMEKLFDKHPFETVIHLAAQPGVRYSVENPAAYIDTNLVGFGNILEGCRHQKIKHLVYASSSSVYGANPKLPFSEHDLADHPFSLYAATKRANELMAHSYAHLFKLPCTGLRFFTVYGPWCRPDMSLFGFTRNIIEGKPITVFNHGEMMRDFTYVDDIIYGVRKILNVIPQPISATTPDPAISASAPYHIYNIGNHAPVQLKHYIEVLESCIGKKAEIIMMPMQAGDVPNTYADVTDLEKAVGTLPHTPIEKGIANFVEWYKEYYFNK